MPVLLSLLLAAAPDADLLKKVGEHLARLDAFDKVSDVTVTTKAEEVDGDGKVIKVKEFVSRDLVRNGKRVHLVIKQVDDGKDVTADAQKEAEEEAKKDKKPKDNDDKLPFDTSEQKKYVFALLPESAKRPGLVHVGFQPAGEKVPELAIGDAFLDPAKGELVHIDFRLSKNPMFVDSFAMSIEYGAETPAGRAVSELSLQGAGGVAFVKKRGRATTKLVYAAEQK